MKAAPQGAASNSPLQGQVKPPAMRVVLPGIGRKMAPSLLRQLEGLIGGCRTPLIRIGKSISGDIKFSWNKASMILFGRYQGALPNCGYHGD